MSSKWAQAQEIYYQDNPDTRDANFYSGQLWAKRIIGQLIEMSLQLWDARNKELHGATPEEQRQMQRVRTIQVVTQKFREGNRQLREEFSHLYREPCNVLCDRSTLQLLKWIETFNACWGSIRREDTKQRRRLRITIKHAFKSRHLLSKYSQILLFKDKQNILCRRDTRHLQKWVETYNRLTPLGPQGHTTEQDSIESFESNRRNGSDMEGYGHTITRTHFTTEYSGVLTQCIACEINSYLDRGAGFGGTVSSAQAK